MEQLATEAHARRTDPDTSHEAARSITDMNERQQAVHKVMRLGGPMTDPALVTLYNSYRAEAQGHVAGVPLPKQSESGIRTRRNELAKAGLVRKHSKVKLMTGRSSWRWTVVPKTPRQAGY